MDQILYSFNHRHSGDLCTFVFGATNSLSVTVSVVLVLYASGLNYRSKVEDYTHKIVTMFCFLDFTFFFSKRFLSCFTHIFVVVQLDRSCSTCWFRAFQFPSSATRGSAWSADLRLPTRKTRTTSSVSSSTASLIQTIRLERRMLYGYFCSSFRRCSLSRPRITSTTPPTSSYRAILLLL